MDTETQKRITAERIADTCNRIKGTPISQHARELSWQWVHGKISGGEMIRRLVAFHQKPE